MVIVGCAIAMSVSYVIPNAQAVQAVSVADPVEKLEAQQSEPVTGVEAATIARDAYSVTAKPKPPPPTQKAMSWLLLPSSSSATLQWPVPAGTRVASPFGPRSCGGCSSFHEGIDLSAPGGSPVWAMAAGVVTETNAPGWSSLGVHVRIQHVIDGEVVTSIYAHLASGSMPFAVGDAVTAGQVVGAVGCTGSCSGDHLHFEVHPGGGAAVDPAAWFQAKLG